MLELQWPWLLYLLPLPLLVRLLPGGASADAALRVPFFQRATRLQAAGEGGPKTRWLPLMLLWLIWCATLLAASNPRWLGDPITQVSSGRDMMLVVDVSGSMEIEDMVHNGQPIDRLEALKIVAADFIERRRGDRLGLILFGEWAYLYAPLTHDLDTVNQFMQETQIGFAGRRTAIGDGIGLGVKRLRERPAEQRVMVLLTDGANNAGELDPIRAARLAAMEGITIHTVGFGADEMIVDGLFGPRRINPTHDLDEEAMIAVAEMTGGRYMRARNMEELDEFHRMVDELEPVELHEETFRPMRSLFHWPLALAFALSLLWAAGHCLGTWRNNRLLAFGATP